MTDNQFLEVISRSFKEFLISGSRSNKKLKILHGAIAQDLRCRLDNSYTVFSLCESGGSEGKIAGRYIDKNVDILISKNSKPFAGVAVKFVMQNYAQNSNNYFENMMGETANIRAAQIPYFQIFIIPDKLPYYDKSKNICKWETFSAHNAKKYLVMSHDNIEMYYHTPTKTLLYVVSLPEPDISVVCSKTYKEYYESLVEIPIKKSQNNYGAFGNTVVYNEYEIFANKLVSYLNYL